MSEQRIPSALGIIELEQRDQGCYLRLSFAERGELLAVACRDAAAVEASRIRMGLPPSKPAPWPDSTWKFLAEAMRRVGNSYAAYARR